MIRNFFRIKGDGELTDQVNQEDAETIDISRDGGAASGLSDEPQGSLVDDSGVREAELTGKLLRLQADFDNFRKRTIASRAEARDEARREIVLDLLPIYDNFLRAMDHAEEMEDYGSLHTGVAGILQQMREFFKRQGCSEIVAGAGTEFDPNLHDAAGMVQGNGERQNTIAQELQKGFQLNGNVIRPAQVIVYSGG